MGPLRYRFFLALLWLLPLRAVAEPVTEAAAHVRQARTYARGGELEKAIVEWRAAFALDPDPDRLFEIGAAYEKLGDRPHAIESYRSFTELDRSRRAAEARTRVAKLTAALRAEEAAAGTRDADGDGVANAADRCPDAAEDRDGVEDGDGCPDLDDDRDGIADAVDRCPKVAEDVDQIDDLDGCPDDDDDHDGLGDAADRCPRQAEDKDGVDDLDGCPDPDDDGDAVLDAADRCPKLFEDPDGFEDGDGCPEPDNDKDGFLDGVDRCPIAAGKFAGCPPLKQWVKGNAPMRFVSGVVFLGGVGLCAVGAYHGIKATSVDEMEAASLRSKMKGYLIGGGVALGVSTVLYLLGQHVGGHYEDVAPTFSLAPTPTGGAEVLVLGRF